MKTVLTISGVNYRRKKCSLKKTEIQSTAESIRKKGGTARVIDNETHYCLYVGPKRTTRKTKSKSQKKK